MGSASRAHLFDLIDVELAEHCGRLELSRFAAKQILDWVYAKGVTDPEAMTNLSKDARAKFAETLACETAAVAAEQIATDDTRKLLLRWPEQATGSLPV